MPKRISKRPMDVNEAAFQMVQRSTAETQPVPTEAEATRSEISRVMTEMGRRGGLIGGKRRLKTMTKAQRREIASKAAKSRWKKAKKR